MKDISTYMEFLKDRGIPLSGINPGSDEMALTDIDALLALQLLSDSQVAVLGGDILSVENHDLTYAYQLWGDEYLCLNWYCDRYDNESEEEYLQRSYLIAREGIAVASRTAETLSQKCYIVLVTG